MYKYVGATKKSQGWRKNDFSFVDEGEPVNFGSMCDRATPDDKCGCARAMCALDGKGATTTVMVMETDEECFKLMMVDRIIEHYTKDWSYCEDTAKEMALENLEELEEMAERYPVGRVIEIRGSKIQTRDC
jgi:hypothetical protein